MLKLEDLIEGEVYYHKSSAGYKYIFILDFWNKQKKESYVGYAKGFINGGYFDSSEGWNPYYVTNELRRATPEEKAKLYKLRKQNGFLVNEVKETVTYPIFN